MTDRIKQSGFSTLLVNRHDNGLVVVTLNRPEVGNAVNTEMGLELLDFWTDLVRNHDGLRCVVLTGCRGRCILRRRRYEATKRNVGI